MKATKGKPAMLEALINSLGIVHLACQKARIDRTTHYLWLRTDEEYKAKVEEINEIALDFVESKLFENIKNLNQQAIQYYLSCKGKSRGYASKAELEIQALGVLPQVIVIEKNPATLPPVYDEADVTDI